MYSIFVKGIYFLFLFLSVISLNVKAQATVTLLPNRSKFLGDTLNIPLHLTANNVGIMTFYIDYDASKIVPTFAGTLLPDDAVPGYIKDAYYYDYNSSYAGLNIFVLNFYSKSFSAGLTFSNEVVAYLNFTIVGITAPGTTLLHVRRTPDTPLFSNLWNAGLPFPVITNQTYIDVDITCSTVIPINRIIDNEIISNGETRCYNALQTITVAGGGGAFIVEMGSSATMIAGQNIIYLSGSQVQSGGYLHAFITTNNQYCGQQSPPIASAPLTGEAELSVIARSSTFITYPNPTSGNITLEFTSDMFPSKANVEIYSMQGKIIQEMEMMGERKTILPFAFAPSGIYFIRVTTETNTETGKVIKQ